MSREWQLYLRDIERFCLLIISYRGNLDRASLEADSLRYDAILRNIELIGEAARNLPEDVRAKAPEIPWKAIVRVRNILAHMYFGVDDDAIWDIVVNEIPILLSAIQRLRENR